MLCYLHNARSLQVTDGCVHEVGQWSLLGSYVCFATTSLDIFGVSLLQRLCTTCCIPNYCCYWLMPSECLSVSEWTHEPLYCSAQDLKNVPCSKYHWLSIPGVDWLLDLLWGSWLQCRQQLGWCLLGTI